MTQPPPPPPEPAVPPPASADQVSAAWSDNALAQVLYHDWEADTYDEKWSISFDERCTSYARGRFLAALGPGVVEPTPYARTLEIGAGTGFFSLNLHQAGLLDEICVTDLSAAMVAAAQRNAEALGFSVEGRVADVADLPFADASFDLVVGHAVLHHVPDIEAALREVLRVLRPGGRFVICGEPTRWGDWVARRLGRATWWATTRVTRLPGLRGRWNRPQAELDESSRAAALEAVVDLHVFDPAALGSLAERVGAERVRTSTEELTAAWFGWPVRTFEVAVNPERLGLPWARFAYRSWLRLSALDRRLAAVVPAGLFYNAAVTGVRPPER